MLVDLSQSGLDITGLVAQIKAVAPAATIVAFGPHVHRERWPRREAGCDVVLSRGGFHAEMDALLARFAN